MILRCEYYMYALLHSESVVNLGCILLNVATEDDSKAIFLCACITLYILFSPGITDNLASDYPDWYHDQRRD